ncbi:T9SS type A sorting domain-containing protein [Flavivirga jejuensis]|uniref:T9SS type A sorting domain-containing protein n=1 Tax=Flavivirga jejuensis TaxID=870487 RepID=A0ABT8WLB9_9FLAO|nr:T9SS type A sorting domain-containing protein [Flavivirga jejuensis]MDO5973855.1 T9SS type A sorting domain-containing protein [Flavivirga jejuensis]
MLDYSRNNYHGELQNFALSAIGDTGDTSNWVGGIIDFTDYYFLSINDEVFSNTISVSSNPVTNILNTITASGVELKHTKLYSIVGKELVSTTSSQLDASSLPSGMYILEIESTDGEIQTKKIIKNSIFYLLVE